MAIKSVRVNDYLNNIYNKAVHCKIDVLDYNKRKEKTILNTQDYVSDFMRFAKVTDYYIADYF